MTRPPDKIDSPHTRPNKAERVRRMFDRIARRYTLINTLISFGRDACWRREAVRLAQVQPMDRLLDVCCGPGDLADAFAAADPPPAHIVACDFSHQMILEAARRQSRRPRPIELVEADAMDLPFPDGCFDLVSCAFGIRNLADPRAGLAEFVRVLAPGGRVVVLEFVASARALRWSYRFYFRHVLPRVGGLVSRHRPAYQYLPRSVETFLSARQIADMLRAASLDDVRQRSMMLGVVAATVGRKP